MKANINNVIRIPTNLKMFFRYWFLFLAPFHKLSGREIDIAALLIYNRYELSKVISDNEILDKVLMSADTRKKILEETNISLNYYQLILGKLKKNKVIINNRINPKFVPNITEDSGAFKLMLLFDIE